MLGSGCCFLLGAGLQAGSSSLVQLIIGRCILGFGVGEQGGGTQGNGWDKKPKHRPAAILWDPGLTLVNAAAPRTEDSLVAQLLERSAAANMLLGPLAPFPAPNPRLRRVCSACIHQ